MNNDSNSLNVSRASDGTAWVGLVSVTQQRISEDPGQRLLKVPPVHLDLEMHEPDNWSKGVVQEPRLSLVSGAGGRKVGPLVGVGD